MLTKKQPAAKAETKTATKKSTSKATASGQTTFIDKPKNTKTHVTIRHDVGFNNNLYIRGRGANLSWDRGTKLHNTKSDEWIWETDASFTNCEFKVLINDHIYEIGENHTIRQGATYSYSPRFIP